MCPPLDLTYLKPNLGIYMWSPPLRTLISLSTIRSSSKSWRLASYVAAAVMIIERSLHALLSLRFEVQVEISYPSSPPPSPNELNDSRRQKAPTLSTSPSLTPPRDAKKKALLIGICTVRNQPIQKPPPRLIPKLSQWKRDRPNPRPTEFSQAYRRRSLTLSYDMDITFLDLQGPHQDVETIKQLLIDVYDYQPSDITILIDNDDPEQIQPTRENILAQIDELVKDVQPQDKLFFHYSGHGDQQLTNDPSEEDEMDEMIPTCDGMFILDNELNERLIKPLPAQSQLTAILDCCHSGSLLDLQHFRCNGVYVPWVNKGVRRTNTIHNIRTRKYGLTPLEPNREREVYITDGTSTDNRTESLELTPKPLFATVNFKSDSTSSLKSSFSTSSSSHTDTERCGNSKPFVRAPRRRKRTITLELSITTLEKTHENTWVVEELCTSPEDEYCSGFCPFEEATQVANVICISSAEDADMAWSPENGEGMTQKLCQILRKEHHPTLSRLLASLAHSMHRFYLDLHKDARAYRKRVAAKNQERFLNNQPLIEPFPAEMDNFLNPIMSSHTRLDMNNTLWQP